MKKKSIITLTLLFKLITSGCSVDESSVLDQKKIATDEFTGKMIEADNDGVLIAIEECQILYTFNNPNLSASEKEDIRESYNNNYFGVYNYISNGTNQEIWNVECNAFEAYNNNNPNCDTDGCYSCVRSGCASTPPKDPDPLDDPIDND